MLFHFNNLNPLSPNNNAHSDLRFRICEPGALYHFSLAIRRYIYEARETGKDIVILCIGTDRSTGDCLGPLTGAKLKSLNPFPHIFGTLDEPVHATNLSDQLDFIHTSFFSPFIIAVDACLGKSENIGSLTLGRGALRPGAAVNKCLPPVGDAYITGIVNVGGFMEHLVLQSTRLNLVMKMADNIAYGLSYGLGRSN